MMTFKNVSERNRFRFNSGFHDAQSDAENGRQRREMGRAVGRQYPLPKGKEWEAYRAGYVSGWLEWYDTKQRNESSESAWMGYAETR